MVRLRWTNPFLVMAHGKGVDVESVTSLPAHPTLIPIVSLRPSSWRPPISARNVPAIIILTLPLLALIRHLVERTTVRIQLWTIIMVLARIGWGQKVRWIRPRIAIAIKSKTQPYEKAVRTSSASNGTTRMCNSSKWTVHRNWVLSIRPAIQVVVGISASMARALPVPQ